MFPDSTNTSLALNTAEGTTAAGLSVAEYQSGGIFVPTGSAITSLTYYGASYSGDTYLPAYDAAGNAIVQTVAAAKCYAMPATVFGFALIKIVTNAAGTVKVSLKGR